jgi:Uncharacterised nucleotidyltransferase
MTRSPELSAIETGRALTTAIRGTWRAETVADNEYGLGAISTHLVLGGLSGLACRVLPAAIRASRLARELRTASRADAAGAARLDSNLPAVTEALNRAGVDAIVTKGWAVACNYPDPGARPYCDIDVSVRPDQCENARRALIELGISPSMVDLHIGLPDLPQRTWAEVWRRTRGVELGDTPVRVLAPEDQFRLLAVHFVRHACCRPLWLVDLAVLLEVAGEEMDWDLCLRGAHCWRRWLLATAGLAHRLLGAQLPRAIANLPGTNPPDWLIAATLWRWGGGYELASRELMRNPREWAPHVAYKWLNPARWLYRFGLPPVRFLPPVWAGAILARGLQPYPRLWRALVKRFRPSGTFPVHEERRF